MTVSRAPLRSVRAVALALATVLTVAAPVGSASAHDELTGSTPADGATVEVAPGSVDLTFGEPPLGIGAEVRVTGPDGQVVNDGDAVVVDSTVSQALAADLPAGQYAVAWRVTSGDGHPISGELTFTATSGPAEEPAPTPTTDGTQQPSTEPTTTPSTEPPTVSQGTGTDTAAASTGDDSPGATPWVLGGLLVVGAAAAALWAARRRTAGGGQG